MQYNEIAYTPLLAFDVTQARGRTEAVGLGTQWLRAFLH